MKKIICIFSLLASIAAFAHEGHDNVPGAQVSKMVPPGQVKATSHMFVEVKEEKGTIKVLIFDHEKKDIPLSDLKLEGSIKFPRKQKAETVKFQPAGNMFEAKIDTKNSYRYTLDLKVTHSGKVENLSFNIEPQQ